MRSFWNDFKSDKKTVWENTGFFYNDYLEHLFYEGLNKDNRDDNDLSDYFDFQVPYLNGGLFKKDYEKWNKNESKIINDIFSNKNDSFEGDGILDIFDTYNFTIDEDDLYDSDIAIDPEMLGRIFEKMISISEDNIDKLSYNPSNEDIDIYFGKIRFNKEGKARSVVKKILSGDYGDDIDKKVIDVEKELLDLNKSELIHYVSLRKVILDLYQNFISFDSDDKYPKEEKIHNLIFPMGKNNTNLDYDKHNLWLIDESLIFSDYITSDKAIVAEDGKKTEPDMLIFRDGKEKYSPVYIIEFKRPGRKTYSDDPLKQILGYAKRLRSNKEITIDGRPINVVPETPIYGYFIGDITQKVRDSIEINDVITMESGESYYGYHKNLNVYYSIYSFDFVYKNSEQRNKVFFDKLGIDLEK